MPNPTAAMLVIGDEILSGRTKDANLSHLAGVFCAAGIDLKEARVVSDDPDAITNAVTDLSSGYDIVVTSGGIGPTHDDITADCIAAAFGVGIDVRDDARAILAARYEAMGTDLNEARLRMARIPDTADLIPNVVSGAPGFRLKNVYVMAGVPSVFRAMLAHVLPDLGGGTPTISHSIRVDLPEGEIAGPLGEIAKDHAALSIGSYPFFEDNAYGANIVVRGHDADAITAAANAVRAAFGIPDSI